MSESEALLGVPQQRQQRNKRLAIFGGIGFTVLVVTSVVTWAITQGHWKGKMEAAEVCTSPACVRVAEMVNTNMRPEIDPCDDFFEYVCGNVAVEAETAPSRAASFSYIDARNRQLVQRYLSPDRYVSDDAVRTRPTPSTPTLKIATDVYDACVAADRRLDQVDLDKVVSQLQVSHFAAAWTASELAEKTAQLHLAGADPLFYAMVQPSHLEHESGNFGLTLIEGGLSMHPSAYQKVDEVEKLRLSVQSDFDKLQKRVGDVRFLDEVLPPNHDFADVADVAEAVVAVETALAAVHKGMDMVDFLTGQATLGELVRYSGDVMDWPVYVNTLRGSTDDKAPQYYNVAPREFFMNLSQGLKSLSSQQLSVYLQHRYLTAYATHLFASDAEALLETDRAREDKCTDSVMMRMPDLATRIFADATLAEQTRLTPGAHDKATLKESQKLIEQMVDDIAGVFRRNLLQKGYYDFLDDATRQEAVRKLDQMQSVVGFPDHVMNDETLATMHEGLADVVDKEAPSLHNMWALQSWNNARTFAKIGLPHRGEDGADRVLAQDFFGQSPLMTNAFYYPFANKIFILAGISHAPMFDHELPLAWNYGAIGLVVSHEITHGFDNNGANFDGRGAWRNWWSDWSRRHFDEATQCLVDQYADFSMWDVHTDGALTLGENIADNSIASPFRAVMQRLKDDKSAQSTRLPLSPRHPLAGMTDEQAFFVGFATSWCTKQDKARYMWMVDNDPHSAPKFRVLGTLRNSKEFSEAFQCPLGSGMNPEHKCRVW